MSLPDIARDMERYLNAEGEKTYPAAVADDVDSVEQLYSVHLPAELKQWLTLSGGGQFGEFELFGLKDAQRHRGIERFLIGKWPRSSGIPIASDAFGNFFCMCMVSTNGRFPVGYVEATSRSTIEFVVSSSLERFLKMLLNAVRRNKEDWYADAKYVRKHDPDLEQVTGFVRPWELK